MQHKLIALSKQESWCSTKNRSIPLSGKPTNFTNRVVNYCNGLPVVVILISHVDTFMYALGVHMGRNEVHFHVFDFESLLVD